MAIVVWLSSGLGASYPPAARASTSSGTYTVFLPFTSKTNAPAPVSFTPNSQELAIANFMRSDPNQRRPSLNWNSTLAQVARARAQDMATRDYFSHVNPDGDGPNYLVQKAGYQLPSWYDQSLTANNIESIAGGAATPTDVWNLWMSSSTHRTHLLGLDPFYAAQIDYGIGFVDVPGSPFEFYWVVITARH